jgi:uncharacterized SAM-binding protein YcdF (DUF218 family)
MRKVFKTGFIWVFVGLLAAVGSIAILGAHAGSFLIVNEPKRADVIVVLSGDFEDVRFRKGLDLLRAGYAQELVLDAPVWTEYGRKSSDLALEYVSTVAPDQASHLHVCSFSGDSTRLELSEVASCLHAVAPQAGNALLVTSNFHARRAFAIARRVLPQYRWSVASAPDNIFDSAWWRRREWAKTTLSEWEKLTWWLVVERWSVTGGPSPTIQN